MKRLFVVVAGLCLAAVPGLSQQRGLTQDQIRTAAVEVPRLVELLDLEPGMTVADVGAGFGAWTVELSRWTGSRGHVFSTDVGDAQLTALRDAVTREALTNVTVIEGAVDSTNLPAGCCDAILIRDAYHHLTEPEAMIRSFAAALAPGGRLAVIDFPPRENSSVPDGVSADRGGHGVPPEVVEREVGALLTHVSTAREWSPESQPAALFLVIFEKPGNTTREGSPRQ